MGLSLMPFFVAFSIRASEFAYCCEHFFVAYPCKTGMSLRTVPSRNLLGFSVTYQSCFFLITLEAKAVYPHRFDKHTYHCQGLLAFFLLLSSLLALPFESIGCQERKNMTPSLTDYPCHCHFPLPNILIQLMRNTDVY